MEELLNLFKDYNPIIIISIIVTVYVAGKKILEEATAIKNWYNDKLHSYHNEEHSKEEKEQKTEERFKAIEEKLGSDYIRIQKSESHLYKITEELKEFTDKFNNLNNMLIDLRLETMRARILDFAPLAIDLTHLQSRGKYTEIYKVHGDYIKLIEDTGKDKDDYEIYNFDLVKKSYEQRSMQRLFTEDCYIAPSNKQSDKMV